MLKAQLVQGFLFADRWRSLGRWVLAILNPPISPLVPVIAQHLGWVLGATRAIAALQGTGGAVFVATPADSLWVFGVKWEFFGHGELILGCSQAKGFDVPHRRRCI